MSAITNHEILLEASVINISCARPSALFLEHMRVEMRRAGASTHHV